MEGIEWAFECHTTSVLWEVDGFASVDVCVHGVQAVSLMDCLPAYASD